MSVPSGEADDFVASEVGSTDDGVRIGGRTHLQGVVVVGAVGQRRVRPVLAGCHQVVGFTHLVSLEAFLSTALPRFLMGLAAVRPARWGPRSSSCKSQSCHLPLRGR